MVSLCSKHNIYCLEKIMEVIKMKTNFKRIGKQSISIVLAVMMMLSTMLVGMVTSNAADTFTKGSTLYFDTKATRL